MEFLYFHGYGPYCPKINRIAQCRFCFILLFFLEAEFALRVVGSVLEMDLIKAAVVVRCAECCVGPEYLVLFKKKKKKYCI